MLINSFSNLLYQRLWRDILNKMDKNSYSFDYKTSTIDQSGIELFTLHNFKTSINDEKPIYFNGKYFGITFGAEYAHLMMHLIGPYLYLKNTIPDLQLIFLRFEESKDYLTQTKASEDLAKILGAPIIDVNSGNYCFEDFMFFYLDDFHITVKPIVNDENFKTCFPIIPSSLFLDKFYFVEPDSKELESFETYSLLELYKYFSPFLKLNNNKEKIYIKRARNNYNKSIMSTTQWFKDIKYLDDLFYDYLEELLTEKGYRVVELDGMNFIEQINLFYNASIVASIEGTSMFNALWCEESTNIFRISANKVYKKLNHPWNRMINTVKIKNVTLIDVTEDSPKDGINKIVKQL